MNAAHFILYVRDQAASTTFYAFVLDQRPTLDVPGMTEFTLREGTVFGLMPETGIKRLLGAKLPDPSSAHGVPRAELYLRVDKPELFHERAVRNGAVELSPVSPRDWGDRAGYSLDPDGHVLAFAEPLKRVM
ncbi:MAG: VOC family protein [Candidatus Ozemobacteraceae bacterium]